MNDEELNELISRSEPIQAKHADSSEVLAPLGELCDEILTTEHRSGDTAAYEAIPELPSLANHRRKNFLAVVAAAVALIAMASAVIILAGQDAEQSTFSEPANQPTTVDTDTVSDDSLEVSALDKNGEPRSSDTPEPDSNVDSTPLDDGEVFADDFVNPAWEQRYDFQILHRDDVSIAQSEWFGNHAPLSGGVEDNCTSAGFDDESLTRVITRGERATDFNNEWIYRCAPENDTSLAHLLTSIGDTSGYSIGLFTPKADFEDITEVSWDVNQTDLGDRKWTEVAIIPAETFDITQPPCNSQVSCDTVTHDVTRSVGTHWGGLRTRTIHTPDEPSGFVEGSNGSYRCEGCDYVPSRRLGSGSFGANDQEALTDINIRRSNFFRDNGDGTLTWGYRVCTANCDLGEPNPQFRWDEFTVPGEFPRGKAHVVFMDHSETPLKEGGEVELAPARTFTWHWDNIKVKASG